MYNNRELQGFALGALAAIIVVGLGVAPVLALAGDGLGPPPQTDGLEGFGGSSPLVIPAAAFTSDGNDPDGFYFDFAGGYVNGDGTACLKAAAHLPHGATVTSVHASLYDNASGNIMVNLRRVDEVSGSSDVMVSFGTAVNGTSIQQVADESINFPEVSYPGYAYYVTTCLNYAEHRLYAVQIYYDRYLLSLPIVLRNSG